MIENVARAIWTEQRNHWGRYRDMVPDLCEWEELTQSKQRELLREAKAAIAAMQPAPQEPVAWRYERTDGFVILVSKRYTDQHPKGDGWTEQALGVIPTPPNGGSDAE